MDGWMGGKYYPGLFSFASSFPMTLHVGEIFSLLLAFGGYVLPVPVVFFFFFWSLYA